MRAEFRATDAPVASRADYWRHVVNERLFPVEGRPTEGADFDGRLVSGQVGAVRVVDVTAPPAECRRTAKLIGRSNHELYHVDVLVTGSVLIEHAGRRTRLGPGDFAMIDLSRPCRWVSAGARHVTVTFPRALLPMSHDEVGELMGVRVPGDRGAGALISSVARQLPDHLDDYQSAAGVRLGTTVVDLLTVALAAQLDRGRTVTPEARRRVLLAAVHAYIERRLGDPGLTPATIAAAHHISLRYLHKLFEAQGTTVAGWIRRRRLDRCRADLLDPAYRARPVGAIGARWGFPDASKFSRVFRAAHGVPPGEYRRLAPAEPDPR
ncbi:MAG TPA: helix-turn-helix domain-containing protein [Streptosporangiaceae bacterium]|nr:helix-turn-helix domain-containing protein [Streptosporangiaceae bacterium]